MLLNSRAAKQKEEERKSEGSANILSTQKHIFLKYGEQIHFRCAWVKGKKGNLMQQKTKSSAIVNISREICQKEFSFLDSPSPLKASVRRFLCHSNGVRLWQH
jgi:hypothetical protein